MLTHAYPKNIKFTSLRQPSIEVPTETTKIGIERRESPAPSGAIKFLDTDDIIQNTLPKLTHLPNEFKIKLHYLSSLTCIH